MPQSFLSWGNFSIMFASYAPAALLALAIIIPLTAGDYDLSVGATLTLAASTIGVLNVWQQMPILLVLVIVIGIGRSRRPAAFAFHRLFPRPLAGRHARLDLADERHRAVDDQFLDHRRHRQQPDHGGGRLPAVRRTLRLLLRFGRGAAHLVRLRLHATGATAAVRRARPRSGAAERHCGRPRARRRAGHPRPYSRRSAGIIYAGILGSADPYSGLNYLLPAFAAAFLGATTIQPGRFNPWGTIVAVYFLATGITGLSMLGIPLWVTNVFNGAALILAVTISQITRGRETSDIG